MWRNWGSCSIDALRVIAERDKNRLVFKATFDDEYPHLFGIFLLDLNLIRQPDNGVLLAECRNHQDRSFFIPSNLHNGGVLIQGKGGPHYERRYRIFESDAPENKGEADCGWPPSAMKSRPSALMDSI